LNNSIETAENIAMRFHACRGSMNVGESDNLVENEAAILKNTQRLIESYHDDKRHAMTSCRSALLSFFSQPRIDA